MVWVQDLLVEQLPEVKYEWFSRLPETIVGGLRHEETMVEGSGSTYLPGLITQSSNGNIPSGII